MKTLPLHPDRELLRVFWFVLWGGCVGLVCLLAEALIPLSGAGVLGWGSVFVWGILQKSVSRRVYMLWRRLGYFWLRCMRIWTSAVIFFGFLRVVKLAGSRLSLDPIRADSYWAERSTMQAGDYVSSSRDMDAGRVDGSWVVDYLSWCPGTGNRWAGLLLPLLMILRFVDPDEHASELPRNIYTLF